jgi:hypothetical protein
MLLFAITMRSYRLISGMSAGGLGISSPKSVSVGPDGFVCVAWLATPPRCVSADGFS